MSHMDGCVFGCLNDGRCELFLNRYMCNCRIGYTGDACQVSFGITYQGPLATVLLVTVLRCWWYNHYLVDIFNVKNRSPTI